MTRWSPSWERWYRQTLPAYWIFLFACTHFPATKGTAIPANDKLIHFCVFGLLALLFWKFFETFTRPVRAGFVWIALPILAAYAALDEYLQQFVHRGTDIEDWLANVAGIITVLGVLEWRRRRTVQV